MAVISTQNDKTLGQGAVYIKRMVVTLASGTASIVHGFKVIESMSYTVLSTSAAVDETLTLVVTTIPTAGHLTSTGTNSIKSSNGSSTATFLVKLEGY